MRNVFSETARSIGYSVYDSLWGGHVLQHLKDMETVHADPEKLSVSIDERLHRLLSHAVQNIRFYREAGVSPGSLHGFPVVHKPTIKEHRDDFIWSSLPDRQRFAVSTSGSYGSSMVFLHSRDKLSRRRAEVLFYNMLAGYKLGARFVFLRSQPKAHRSSGKTALSVFAQNEVKLNLASLDTEELDRVIARLQVGDIRFIVGWPSVLRVVAERAGERGIVLGGINGTVTMGEALHEADRVVIERSFNCRTFNRYACKETGVLAHEFQPGEGLIVNRNSYLIEVLCLDCDKPVALGQAGRIVVTDLHSFAMPLIRYDTGDIGIMRSASSTGTISLESVDGRYVERFFDTKGRGVLSMSVIGCLPRAERRKMWQYQFVQEGPGVYAVNVIQGSVPIIEEPVIASLKNVLGEDAEVRINYVCTIPRLPSGKHALMVNRTKPI